MPGHVMLATAYYPPHDMGGTEIYVEGLAQELRNIGVGCSVLVPRGQGAGISYMYRDTLVETYPVNELPLSGELRGERPHLGFDVFCDTLRRRPYAIYHQHTWTRGSGALHLKAAREFGHKTVLTVHVPGTTCLRGTMLRLGTQPCDGRIDDVRCAACWAERRGLPESMARALARLPLGVSAQALKLRGRTATAVASRALVAARRTELAAMIVNADRIVAVCQWLYDVLAENGVPASKLVLSRQGVSNSDIAGSGSGSSEPRQVGRPLRCLLLGRWDPVKGIDVAVNAVRALPRDVDLELRVCGVPGSGDTSGYAERVRHGAAGDARIRIEGSIARSALAQALAETDVLLVPSIWFETGPLVVLEAQAAGVFVLGSRRGGIAELVDEVDGGELIEPGDVAAWSSALARLAARRRLGPLPRPSRPVRTMANVAADMAEVYATL